MTDRFRLIVFRHFFNSIFKYDDHNRRVVLGMSSDKDLKKCLAPVLDLVGGQTDRIHCVAVSTCNVLSFTAYLNADCGAYSLFALFTPACFLYISFFLIFFLLRLLTLLSLRRDKSELSVQQIYGTF